MHRMLIVVRSRHVLGNQLSKGIGIRGRPYGAPDTIRPGTHNNHSARAAPVLMHSLVRCMLLCPSFLWVRALIPNGSQASKLGSYCSCLLWYLPPADGTTTSKVEKVFNHAYIPYMLR